MPEKRTSKAKKRATSGRRARNPTANAPLRLISCIRDYMANVGLSPAACRYSNILHKQLRTGLSLPRVRLESVGEFQLPSSYRWNTPGFFDTVQPKRFN